MLRSNETRFYELTLSERIKLAKMHVNRPNSDYEPIKRDDQT